jgi:hypothetical protein
MEYIVVLLLCCGVCAILMAQNNQRGGSGASKRAAALEATLGVPLGAVVDEKRVLLMRRVTLVRWPIRTAPPHAEKESQPLPSGSGWQGK